MGYTRLGRIEMMNLRLIGTYRVDFRIELSDESVDSGGYFTIGFEPGRDIFLCFEILEEIKEIRGAVLDYTIESRYSDVLYIKFTLIYLSTAPLSVTAQKLDFDNHQIYTWTRDFDQPCPTCINLRIYFPEIRPKIGDYLL